MNPINDAVVNANPHSPLANLQQTKTGPASSQASLGKQIEEKYERVNPSADEDPPTLNADPRRVHEDRRCMHACMHGVSSQDRRADNHDGREKEKALGDLKRPTKRERNFFFPKPVSKRSPSENRRRARTASKPAPPASKANSPRTPAISPLAKKKPIRITSNTSLTPFYVNPPSDQGIAAMLEFGRCSKEQNPFVQRPEAAAVTEATTYGDLRRKDYSKYSMEEERRYWENRGKGARRG